MPPQVLVNLGLTLYIGWVPVLRQIILPHEVLQNGGARKPDNGRLWIMRDAYLSNRQKSPSQIAGTSLVGQTLPNSSSFLCSPANTHDSQYTACCISYTHPPPASFNGCFTCSILAAPRRRPTARVGCEIKSWKNVKEVMARRTTRPCQNGKTTACKNLASRV